MNTFADLKIALGDTAKKAAKDRVFSDDKDLREANARAIKMFTSQPIYGRLTPGGKPVNITRRAMVRLHIYMKRHGMQWKSMDWETVKQWLIDNWDKILKVMLSLLMFAIL